MSSRTGRPVDERDVFGQFVRRYGTTRPGPGRPAPTQVPDGACWDAAWAAAQAGDGHYVEGTCIISAAAGGKTGIVRAHAWTETDTPFGTVITEHTLGYAGVTTYVGCRINLQFAAPMTDDWPPDGRASILEAAIVGGWSAAQIAETLLQH